MLDPDRRSDRADPALVEPPAEAERRGAQRAEFWVLWVVLLLVWLAVAWWAMPWLR